MRGTVVAGRYEVDRLVARGGTATVWLAHPVEGSGAVALKVLTPPDEGGAATQFEQRFRLEAETLARLDHPNIVALHDHGVTDHGSFYLAMEFVDGSRFSDLLKHGPMEARRALDLVGQVCAGLRHAHGQGIVHRDLKPSNLLVERLPDGAERIRIVDFGIVKQEGQEGASGDGLILGSPHCMAPEQIMGLDVDARADIYAIGVLLFRAVTGRYPFHGPNSAATMIAHLSQPVPAFDTMRPGLEVPDGLEALVRRCLVKEPDGRFDSVDDLVAALDQVGRPPATDTNGRLAQVVVVVLLLAAVVAVLTAAT